MQPLQSYITKKGWKEDLETTAERWSTVLPNQKRYIVGCYVSSLVELAVSGSLIPKGQYSIGAFGLVAGFLTSTVINSILVKRIREERRKKIRAEEIGLLSERAGDFPQAIDDAIIDSIVYSSPLEELHQKVEAMIRNAQDNEKS